MEGAYIVPIWHVKHTFLSKVKVIQRATDLAKGFGADMRLELCGLAGPVPQEGLNVAQIGAFFQQGVANGIASVRRASSYWRHSLLPDTEAAEDAAQQVVAGNAPGDLAQVELGAA